VASTKAYTSQFIALTMFALQLSDDNYQKLERRKAIIDGLFELSSNIKKVLALEKEIKDIAQKRFYKDIHDVIILGRGYQSATCLEAALKIKEVTYVHAEGILAGELKHGPLALIDPLVPILMCMTQDRHYSDSENALKQVTARGGRPVIICSEGDQTGNFDGLEVIQVPTTVDALQGIVNIIPFQLLAYHMAVARGINPDCPRNLAKSVTTA
jgi:glucosamine--fructose-6-phosphate aminotransferase (isomerizing)